MHPMHVVLQEVMWHSPWFCGVCTRHTFDYTWLILFPVYIYTYADLAQQNSGNYQLTRTLRMSWRFQRTLSRRFFQASSRCDMRSMQCERVAMIPAVVALKVKASPLKSTEWPPCCDNTDSATKMSCKSWTDRHTLSDTQVYIYASLLRKKMRKNHTQTCNPKELFGNQASTGWCIIKNHSVQGMHLSRDLKKMC